MKFKQGTWENGFPLAGHTTPEVNAMRKEEKQPMPWEAVDPKPPVIQSGHLENQVRRENDP